MLFDLERGAKLIKSDDLKEMDVMQKFLSVNDPRTIKAVLKRFNSFLDEQNPSQNSQLIWVRLAKMFGRSSATPRKDICYIEDVIEKTVGGGKEFLFLAGTLFQMVVADRPETHWLTVKSSETERFDNETGKEIAYRAYWVANNFVVPDKYKKNTLEDLAKKWNRK